MTNESEDQQVLAACARRRVLDRLKAARARDGVLPGIVVRQAASELGCSARSGRRWLASGPPPSHPERRLIDEEFYAAYVRWHGNVAAVRRELSSTGRELPSLRALQRAFVSELRPTERAAALGRGGCGRTACT